VHTGQRTDPFTVEIVLDALYAAAREMFVTLGRTAKSPIIYEVLDYACGIYSADGELIAQDNGVTGFLGTLYFAVQEVRAKFGGSMSPGDIFISNDPWTGNGSHLSDVNLVMPVFFGNEVLAYTVNKAHWTEIGGMHPGSWSAGTTEVYQEGLLFPCVRLARAGELDEAILDLIRANVRTPEDTLGDLLAQAAALRVGARRVGEIAAKYGADAVREAMTIHVQRGRTAARRTLDRLPKGVFEVDDLIENNSAGDPIPVHLRLVINDDAFEVDLSHNPPPVPASVNGTGIGVAAQARTVFKILSDPASPVNEGDFEPLRVVAPEGTIFTAPRPAAVSIHWEYKSILADMVFRALAPHLPDRLTAGHQLSTCSTILAGRHEDGQYWLLVEPQLGGWGAAVDGDGQQGQHPVGNGETYNVPVEVLETRYPIRVEEYRFDTGHGYGAGRFRGGFGVVKAYRILSPGGATLTATFGRHRRPPWGVDGGLNGSPNRVEIHPSDPERPVVVAGVLTGYPLAQGDLVRLITATGGGWGDPRQRDPKRVRADVEDGFITVKTALDVYGVALDERGQVDWERTRAIRGEGEDRA
jgi:N-methylhydantoinase B